MKAFSQKLALVLLSLSLVFVPLFGDYATVFANAQAQASPSNEFVISKTYAGFKLMSVKNMPDIGSSVLLFSHVKTGARLMYVKNDDNERVFSISFRTPPMDNTGVNHIIEHSVLDGSKNYPVKSPFVDMLKGSLGTFINAMTAPDYTTFPVSSTNEKDLQNLMGVYLDAVFYPNFYTDPNIIKQEGWRYQLDAKDKVLSINGVVYNEMSGYYSNPQWLLNNAINQSLFPNTSYKWDSGGNPASIPNLTWEKLIATHKKNYTPSNSYIYLYGKLDLHTYLSFIDQNYLSKFNKEAVRTSYKLQKPLSKIPEKVVDYPLPEAAQTQGKAYLALNFVTGTLEDKTLNVGMDYLSFLLMGFDNAPIKKALLESGIAKNFYSSFNSQNLYQPVFTITAENTDVSSKAKFKKVILDELKKIAKNGFEKNYLNAALTQYDFYYRVNKIAPMKGLTLNFNAMKSWVYHKDPTLYFETAATAEKIKKLAGNKYFENLITQYLLSNTQNSLVVLNPVPGLESTNRKTMTKKLADYRKTFGNKDLAALVNGTSSFNTWLAKEDSAKALSTIPKLSIKNITPELPDLKMQEETDGGLKLLSHQVNLNGISNLNLYFDTSNMPQEKLHYLKLLSSLLGNIDTKNLKNPDLLNLSSMHTSGIFFSATAVPSYNSTELYKPVLSVSLLTLDENIPTALGLVEEIIKNSTFENKIKIKQLIDQNISSLQQTYSFGSGLPAMNAMNAYLSGAGKYIEAFSGLSYYNFLQEISKDFDNKWHELSSNLLETYSLTFNKNSIIACQSGSTKGKDTFSKEIKRIVGTLNASELPAQTYTFLSPDKNIAYSLPVKVQTILKAGSFSQEGYSFSGKMLVLQKILSMEYLWKKVRTAGGAYGVSATFSTDGTVTFMSASDQNLRETLDAFDGSVDFLKNFQATPEEMENYIIGTIGDFLKLKSLGPLYEGIIGESMVLTGQTAESLVKIQDEALSTTAQDIRDYAVLLEKVLKQNTYFIEGSDEKINQNKDLFNKIEVLGK